MIYSLHNKAVYCSVWKYSIYALRIFNVLWSDQIVSCVLNETSEGHILQFIRSFISQCFLISMTHAYICNAQSSLLELINKLVSWLIQIWPRVPSGHFSTVMERTQNISNFYDIDTKKYFEIRPYNTISMHMKGSLRDYLPCNVKVVFVSPIGSLDQFPEQTQK